jgi:alpha-2-macroglobulin
MLDNGNKWLLTNVQNTTYAIGSRALAFRALSETGNNDIAGAFNNFVYTAPTNQPYLTAQIVLTYIALNKLEAAKNKLNELKRLAIEIGGAVHWEKPEQQFKWYYYWDDNPILNTAIALEAVAKLEPQSALIPKIVNYLLAERRGATWVSTQDTSAIVIAALALPQPSNSQQLVQILLDGKSMLEQNISQTGASFTFEPKLTSGNHRLEIQGNVFYSANLQFYQEPSKLEAQNNGIGITREYYRLDKTWNAKIGSWEYTTTPLIVAGVAKPIVVGDLILVFNTINLSSNNSRMRHAQIVAPVPAGFQAFNGDDLVLNGANSNLEFGNSSPWNNWYAGRDIYANRVEMYAESINNQSYFQVFLRAQTAGTYTHLPVTAELMYQPSVRGNSNGATLTIKEQP